MPLNLPNNPTIAFGFVARKLLARKPLVVSIFCWIVAALLTVLFLVPQIGKTVEAYRTLDASKRELATLQEKINFIKTFQGDAYKKQEALVESVLPSTKPLLPLLNSLGQLSLSQQVSLVGIELSPGSISTDAAQVVRSGKELEKLPVKLAVRGDIVHMNSFLDALNTTTPILEMSDISLNPTGSSNNASASGGLYDGEIGLISYYAPLTVKVITDQDLPTLSASDQSFIKELEQFIVYKSTLQPITTENKVDLFAF